MRSSRFFGSGGVSCDDVADALPAIVDGLEVADIEVQRHVAACLRCQAELVQYRKVLRMLHELRTEVLEPAPGCVPDILAALEAAGERRAIHHLLNGRRVAYVGGIAAATAAGAAGAILASRRPPPGSPRELALECRAGTCPASDTVTLASDTKGRAVQRAVAQFGRAPVSKTGGWGFESLLPCSFVPDSSGDMP